MKHLCAFLIASMILLSSCTDNDYELEKMIPDCATGIVSINIKSILKNGEMYNGEGFSIPEKLKVIIEKNSTSPTVNLINTISSVGLDFDSKIYIFYTNGVFNSCMIANINDKDNTRDWIEKKEGASFKTKDDIDYLSSGSAFYVLKDNVIFIGSSLFAQGEDRMLKEVKKIINHSVKSIVDTESIKKIIESKNDIVAYFLPAQLNRLMNSNESLRDINSKLPLMRFLTESDVRAITLLADFTKDDVTMKAEAIAAPNSQYSQLIKDIETNSSANFLKIMPSSMDNVFSMSLNGKNVTKLPELDKLLSTISKMPYIGMLDIRSMIATINGPVAVGISKDPTFIDEYNYVFAFTSTDTNLILGQIQKLGRMGGQAPEKVGQEYVYEYMNKRVAVGTLSNIIYIKMLDYELQEPNLYANSTIKGLFNKSKIGIYFRTKDLDGKNLGNILVGSTSSTQCNGKFIPDKAEPNAVQAIFKALCSIKADYNFSNDNPAMNAIDNMEAY